MICLNLTFFCCKIRATRPWLNWIEQQISNLWVAGSSPAGRARNIKPHETFAFIKKHVIIARIRGVAQPGRVLGLGPRCRRFEPSHPDQKIEIDLMPIFILPML